MLRELTDNSDCPVTAIAAERMPRSLENRTALYPDFNRLRLVPRGVARREHDRVSPVASAVQSCAVWTPPPLAQRRVSFQKQTVRLAVPEAWRGYVKAQSQ